MVVEALAALAAAGGTAIVSAVATDAWLTLKTGIARMLGRGDSGRTRVIQEQLDRTEAELRSTDQDLTPRKQRLEAAWTARLEDLLAENPHVAEELRALVRQANSAVPGPTVTQHVVGFDHTQQAVMAQGVQTNAFISYPESGSDGGR